MKKTGKNRNSTKTRKNLGSDAGILVSGTILGQSVIILSSPVLTRLYSPDDFGVLAVYISIFSIVTIVASMRYELAIPLVGSENSALALFILCFMLVAGIALSLGIVLKLSGDPLVNIVNAPLIRDFLWLLPVGVFVGGTQKILNYWALRKKAFSVVALTRVLQGGTMSFSQIGLGYFIKGFPGLIFGHLTGICVGLLYLLRFSLGSDVFSLKRIRWNQISEVAHRYRNFPKYSTLSDLVNVFGGQFPLILFSSLFSPSAAGLYLLANRVANAPAALFAEATGKVFMVTAVTEHRKHNLAVLTHNVFQVLLRIVFGPLVLIAVIAPDAFTVVFGSNWMLAGKFLQLLVPSILAIFIFVPLMTLFAVLELQKAELKFQVTLIVIRIGGLFLGAHIGGMLMAITLYSLGSCLIYSIWGFWLLNKSGVEYKKLIFGMIIEIMIFFPLALIMFLMKRGITVKTFSMKNPSLLVFAGLTIFMLLLSYHRVKPKLASLPGYGKQESSA